MYLEIITPDKKLFSGEVKAIVLPGTDGKFGLLNHHAPIISSLKQGVLKVTDTADAVQNYEIKGGVVEMLNNKVIILAE
jgi:F-type H+-transporting ATPase subunit epsilon